MAKKIVTIIFIVISSSVINFAVADKHQIIHRYQVTLSNDLTVAEINICFDGKPPEYLAIEFRVGNKDLLRPPHSDQGKIETQGRFWKTESLPENACLNYAISLKGYLTEEGLKISCFQKRGSQTKKPKNVISIKDNNWLWIPEIINPDNEIEITFHLPKWAVVSAPWQQVDFNQFRFRLGHQPQEWGYSLVIGDLYHQISRINKQSFLNVVATNNLAHPEQYVRWLTHAAQALQNYLGEYPVTQTQVLLIAKPELAHGPVPWGDVSRGAGFGIRFLIAPKYPIKNFYTDWTVTHEFSHQLLPKINYNESWLSEGLSSYLQYILMAQSGVISKQLAWTKVYAGLQRGQKGANRAPKEPLELTSNHRQHYARSGRTMRIYWSGALYFLKADIALRKQSHGKLGLNDILLKLNHCCLLGDKIWRGKEVADKLDQLAQRHIFSPLYDEFSKGLVFPEYQTSFDELGIELPVDGKSALIIHKDSLAEKIMQVKEKQP